MLIAVGLLAAVLGGQTEKPLDLGRGPLVAHVDYVVDGDTLDLRGQRVRLNGLDAPERGQTCRKSDGTEWSCGAAATDRMRALVKGRELRCDPQTFDRYGRLVADCLDGTTNIAAVLVRDGLAVAVSRFASEEADARNARRGIWDGTFERPSDWRRRTSTDPQSPLDPGGENPSRFERFWSWLVSLLSG